MVFGQPLVVPGEFFPWYTNPTDPTHTDLQAARWAARQFTPCLPTHPTHRDTYIPKSLQSTDYVFVRQDLNKYKRSRLCKRNVNDNDFLHKTNGIA